MSAWFREQINAAREALRQFGRTPASTALNIFVVAIALSLPFAGLTILDNVRPLSNQLIVQPEISVFFTLDTPSEDARALAPKIRQLAIATDAQAKIEFVPRERALKALESRSGLAEAVAALGDNPLPDGYVVRMAQVQNQEEAQRVDALAKQLQQLPEIETVQIDSAWVERLGALMHLARIALALIAVTLGIVVVSVIFNTIRLQVLTQREEIMVSRLFGATDATICRPFYLSGMLLGAISGTLALAVVAASLLWLNSAVTGFARLYASEFALSPLGLTWAATLLAISALLGLLGAALSARRQLARLEKSVNF